MDFHAYSIYNISTKVGDEMKAIQECIDASGMLLAEDIHKNGIKKNDFYQFIKAHKFERLAHGIYLSPDAWEDKAYVLHLRYPQAVFSHDEMLFYYDLVDHEPMQQTITVYSGYNIQKMTASGIKVYTVKKELLPLGRMIVINSFGHEIPIYDLERTICDLARSRSHFEFQDFQAALKRYAKRKDKDLNKLMQYAKQLRVQNVLRAYLEVLL